MTGRRITAAARAAATSAGHLRRSETWNGLRAGDRVSISDVRIRGASWTFRAHVLNERTGTEWIEVLGGRAGEQVVRSFEPERVYPGGVKTRRKGSGAASRDRLSLAEEPQLPFG